MQYFPLKKERAGDWPPCRERNVCVVSPPFPSQLKQRSFAPWAVIWPLRPPFLPAVLSISATHTPCVVGAVGTQVAVPVQGKAPEPRPGFAPTPICSLREWFRGPQPQGIPTPEEPSPGWLWAWAMYPNLLFLSQREGLPHPCCAT